MEQNILFTLIHMILGSGSKTAPLKCPHCQMKITARISLATHFKLFHMVIKTHVHVHNKLGCFVPDLNKYIGLLFFWT